MIQITFKKEKKLASNVKKNDRIRIGEQKLTVRKVERVFHYTPDSTVRMELDIPGFEGNSRYKAVLFLPVMEEITVLT